MARVDTTWWYHNWRLDWCGNFGRWRHSREKLNSRVISSHYGLYSFMISCLELAAPVCPPPYPHPSVSSIHRTRYNKLEQCWNNKDILTLFYCFVCFQLAIRCVIWMLRSELEGKKVQFLHLVADVCEENVPHNRGLYGTLVLARSQRCPYRAAKNTGLFSSSQRVRAYLLFGLLSKAAASLAHID